MKVPVFWICLACLLLLSACGGGGGGSTQGGADSSWDAMQWDQGTWQ